MFKNHSAIEVTRLIEVKQVFMSIQRLSMVEEHETFDQIGKRLNMSRFAINTRTRCSYSDFLRSSFSFHVADTSMSDSS